MNCRKTTPERMRKRTTPTSAETGKPSFPLSVTATLAMSSVKAPDRRMAATRTDGSWSRYIVVKEFIKSLGFPSRETTVRASACTLKDELGFTDRYKSEG
jgi:hypothetical protein